LKPMEDNIVIFDTSIFIDHLRANKYSRQFQGLNVLVRNSSVVLAELLRGATKAAERAFVNLLAKNHPILTPTTQNWIDSGEILLKMNKRKGFLPEKLRDLHFDVLIALTARSYGAAVVTSNRTDFELIKEYKDFRLVIW
jgi:predicted nucleic acid-binding protein